MPCPLLIFIQSDYLIQIVAINSHIEWQTVQIQIRSQLIWIYTVCKDRVYPGSAGQGLNLVCQALLKLFHCAFANQNIYLIIQLLICLLIYLFICLASVMNFRCLNNFYTFVRKYGLIFHMTHQPAWQVIHMKCKVFFSLKNNFITFRISSTCTIFLGTSKVKTKEKNISLTRKLLIQKE